ncbi:hypothetical protein SEA_PICKLES13_32 [Microbacterium phage Pickles13]|nr:hypothetical protein SEA_PICKLES13_32 [Microbacterium phage Pickles13]
MSTITENPLPAFNVDDDGNWAALALCVFDTTTHACIYCARRNVWDTYAEYVAYFWDFEWEGEPFHSPRSEADFDRIASLCLATPADVADDAPVVTR